MSKSTIHRSAAMFAFLFCLASGGATNVDIKGKMYVLLDDSITIDSMPGVNIFLKNLPDMRCTTDEQGSFRLTNNPDADVKQTFLEEKGMQFRVAEKTNGIIIHSNSTAQRVKIGVYNADGRIVASAIFEGAGDRECFVPLQNAACAMHLIKISIDGAVRVFRTIPGMGILKTAFSRQKNGYSALGKKKASSYIDTLVVFSRGYRTGLFGIDSYEKADYVGKLTPSNSWVNCMGPLITKSRSLVSIAAKGYDFEMGQFCDTIWGKIDNHATSDLEQPAHTVLFTYDFFIDSTEVTQGEYDSLMKTAYSGYSRPAWSTAYGMGPNYPAYSVSWDDAVLFCNARSKRDNYDTVYSYSGITGTPGALSQVANVSVQFSKTGYRLPTEAEWEYSCRAGKTADFYWERDCDYYRQADDAIFNEVNTNAIWAKNSWDLGIGNEGFGTHPVMDSGMSPNAYDLSGMAGNVSEWCNDWSGKYQWGLTIDPVGPATGTSRVVRGGNWGSGIFYLRIANRYFNVPSGQNDNIFKGFRTVRKSGEGE